MTKITEKKLLELIEKIGDGKWSSYTKMNGKGDYGYDEIFSFEGKPIFVLSVGFSGSYTEAFLLDHV